MLALRRLRVHGDGCAVVGNLHRAAQRHLGSRAPQTSPWKASNNWSLHQAAYEREQRQQQAALALTAKRAKAARELRLKNLAKAAAAQKAAPTPTQPQSFRLSNNYAMHAARFALRPESRLTKAAAWQKARASPVRAAEAVAEAVVGVGTFIASTAGTLLLGILLGAYTTDMHSGPQTRRRHRDEAELARLRAGAGPPSLDGPQVVRQPTEEDDVGVAGSA
mmetsp:Transcript_93139/g.279407  ORF Transcript_93139/g.279407 Transcript_93139/m.279407 type:complete len:221 (+) Transcript_93139:66-728(+)